MARHTFASLQRRLASAGFKRDFVRQAILPDWWDESGEQDRSLLPDIEIRVARFLGLPLSIVRDADASLRPPHYSSAMLRRVRDIDGDRLSSAIHAAIKIAGAVTRCMEGDPPESVQLPSDGLSWRSAIERASVHITLEDILGDLWRRGIPVVPLEVLPSPNFQGLACIVEDRPTILLGHKHDQPGRVAFIVSHEVGHISSGDCTSEHPVVDEEGLIGDDSDMEQLADEYATHVLVGAGTIPTVSATDYRELAQRAADLEIEYGADAGAIIYAWAARTRDYSQASMAVRALYRDSGARRLLRDHFDNNINFEDASETDRTLLRCVYGGQERVAASD